MVGAGAGAGAVAGAGAGAGGAAAAAAPASSWKWLVSMWTCRSSNTVNGVLHFSQKNSSCSAAGLGRGGGL